MSKRLQVVVDDGEMDAIERAAKRSGQTVSAWVRGVLRVAERDVPSGDIRRKLAVIAAACEHNFPTADIDQMNAEIEAGYLAAEPKTKR